MIKVTMKVPETKDLFDTAALKAKLTALVDRVNDSSHRDFEATCETFEHKPKWKVERAAERDGVISASTSTDDENYARLNDGTDDHLVGRSGQWMSFRPGYVSKTTPMVLGSNPGRYSGTRQRAKGPWTVRGIEAREFDKAVALDHEQILFNGIDKALEETIAGK
jgi:hypothetical protein